MGICLSCLRGNDNEDDYENQALLNNQSALYSESLQENELKQQRMQELNSIVNDLSENLIDVSTFLSNNMSSPNTPHLSYSSSSLPQNQQLQPQLQQQPLSAGSGGPGNSTGAFVDDTYPIVASGEEQDIIEREAKAIDPVIREECRVHLLEPLYVKF